MTRGWKAVLDESAVEFLLAQKGRQRHVLLRFLDNLRSNPYQEGDFVEHDDTSRALQVKALGHFVVTYWADHSVKEMRIVDIASVE